MARSPQVGVRIPAALYPRLCEVARDYRRSPGGWIARVVTNVLGDVLLLRKTELEALVESNRLLWALGNNLNQIAKALNVSIKSSVVPTPGMEKEALALMRRCKRDIEEHALVVSDLIAHARDLRTWGQKP